MRTRWMPAVPLLALAAASCGGDARGAGGLAAVTDTVDGKPRLMYPGEGGLPLSWSADTVMRIGEVMGDDDAYQFDRVSPAGIAGDAAGNVYVLDGAGKRVLSYDVNGRHRATFGRAGSGPGELTQPFGLTLGDADTVWVLDPLNQRLTGFPQDGSDARIAPLVDLSGFPNQNFALKAGGFVMQSSAPLRLSGRGGSFTVEGSRGGGRAPARGATPPAGGQPRDRPPPGARPMMNLEGGDGSIPIFRVAMDGTSRDTLWKSQPPEMNLIEVGGGSGASRTMTVMSMPAQYVAQLRWAAFSDGGIAVIDTDRYEIHLVDPDGKERLVIAREMPAWPVGEKEKEAARERTRNSRIQVTGGNGQIDMGPIIERQLASMTFAETVPRLADIAVDAQDRIWVGVSLETAGETDRVDIYAKDGRFLGSVAGMKVPDAFLLDGRLASLVKDPDTDVQQVAVMKINESGRR